MDGVGDAGVSELHQQVNLESEIDKASLLSGDALPQQLYLAQVYT